MVFEGAGRLSAERNGFDCVGGANAECRNCGHRSWRRKDLWGKPTLINNVETLLVPWIVRNGAEKFAGIGNGEEQGTKFCACGKDQTRRAHRGADGTTIREIVEEIGGGGGWAAVKGGADYGPSGGCCVPARLADTSVDYESLRDVGAIMGSGGLVVLMIRVAWWISRATSSSSQDQSCGK